MKNVHDLWRSTWSSCSYYPAITSTVPAEVGVRWPDKTLLQPSQLDQPVSAHYWVACTHSAKLSEQYFTKTCVIVLYLLWIVLYKFWGFFTLIISFVRKHMSSMLLGLKIVQVFRSAGKCIFSVLFEAGGWWQRRGVSHADPFFWCSVRERKRPETSSSASRRSQHYLESYNGLCWKRPLRSPSFSPAALSRDTFQ